MIGMLVSLAVGVLAGLGVGSGGLLILYFSEGEGMGQLAAQGMNLAVFAFALGAAVLVHLGRRRLSLPILGTVVLGGAAGAAVGSGLAQGLDTDILRFLLGLLLLFMGSVALLRREGGEKKGGTCKKDGDVIE